MEQESFTRDRLSKFDGKDGRPAYVAYLGQVYNVTESVMWEDGEHEDEHSAGVDLTEEIEDAPHFAEELDSFPIVGTLVD